jgi:hypothetical protein
MNEPQNPHDSLKDVWQRESEGFDSEKELVMSRKLLRAKQQSLHDYLQIASSNTYLLALSFVPLFILLALQKRSVELMLIGNIVIVFVLLSGTLITWLFQRRAESKLVEWDMNVLEYQKRLIETIEENIAFSKAIKYCFAPPLFLGISLAAFPNMHHFLSTPVCIGILGVVFICFESCIWMMSNRKRVQELERRRADVQKLIEELH